MSDAGGDEIRDLDEMEGLSDLDDDASSEPEEEEVEELEEEESESDSNNLFDNPDEGYND